MIGIDIERNDRFKDWTDKQITRIFTKTEREYALKQANPERHLCGFFCVKEALVKVLNNQTIEYKKIEVLHTETNMPYIKLSTYVRSLIEPVNATRIDISISHTDEYSTAVLQLI